MVEFLISENISRKLMHVLTEVSKLVYRLPEIIVNTEKIMHVTTEESKIVYRLPEILLNF
jgi:hypothetical protein